MTTLEQADIYSILFVGIDISSRENVVCFLRFGVQQPLKTFSVPNNQPGAQDLTPRKFVRLIYGLLAKGQLYSQDMSTQIQ